MRRLRNCLLGMVLVGAVAATVVVAVPATVASAAPRSRCTQTAVGLIAAKWRSLGGDGGPLGCPTTAERDLPGRRGRVSTFEHGQIVWSPDQGGQLVVAAYQQGRDLVVDWGPTAPFRYDFFLVRHDLDGRNVGQRQAGGHDRGRVTIPVTRDGRYTVAVEGCRSRFARSARCSQRWTAPATVDVRLPAAPPVPRVDPVLSATQDGDRLTLRWDKVGPGWQFFNVRWSISGEELQRETPRDRSGAAQAGQYVVQVPSTLPAGTVFTFGVQGCKRSTVAWFTVRTRCGGWTPPVSVLVNTVVPTHPTPTQPTPKPSASKPPASTAPVGGLSAMAVYNCHRDNHTVHVWVLDQASDGTVSARDRGALAVQYEDPDNAPLRGACPAAGSEPVDLAFTDGHHYQVIIVDPEAIGCPGNDPNVAACHRRWVDVVGNSHGGRQSLVVE